MSKLMKRAACVLASACLAVSAAAPVSAAWQNTQSGWKYTTENGGYASGGWRMVDGKWYYFGQDGKMVTGEQTIAARKCVFGKDGELEYEENGIDPDKPMIALTFDDGPGPRTKELLEALEQNPLQGMTGMNM